MHLLSVYLSSLLPISFVDSITHVAYGDPDMDHHNHHARDLQSSPTSSPTKVFDGFHITSTSASSNYLITVNRTYGLLTDKSRTELLDATCTNQVTKLLYKQDVETTDIDGKLLVTSTIGVKPEEIESAGGEGILYFYNGTLATSPSAIRGQIIFCLKSTSMESLDSMDVAINVLQIIYTTVYTGDDTSFTMEQQITSPGGSGSGGGGGDGGGGGGGPVAPENPAVFENVVEEVEILVSGCEDTPSNEGLGVGDTYHLCIGTASDTAMIKSVNLFAWFDYNPITGEYNSVIPLIENGIPTLSLVNAVTEGDVTRMSVPILPAFVAKPGDRLRLGGNADISFSPVTSEAAKNDATRSVQASSFQIDILLIYEEGEERTEYGCASMLLTLMKQIMKIN